MLGLGLGLSKGANLLSNLKLLTRNASFAFWGDKATGTSKGTNSPQVNPIVDLVGVVGKNLFDPSNFISGRILSPSGSDGSNADFLLSSYLPIKGNLNITGSGYVYAGQGICYYDSNYNYISGGYFTNSVKTTPSNCEYARISIKIAEKNTFQLELGATATAYEPYGKSNGLLTGFGFIPTDGYKDFTMPNGKISTGIQFDGVNSYVRLP